MTRNLRVVHRLLALTIMAAPMPAMAWGNEGHEVIAAIARAYLTPRTLRKVDALLATDTDTLTAPDMLARATWADAWRAHDHRETASWHFIDIELDHPDLQAACFGFPKLAGPASTGPAQDCVVDKVEEFSAELADPATTAPERLLALKYLLHLVGDMHQPLHASDNHDRGGNCVRVDLGGQRNGNLHGYWDTAVVEAQDADPQALADRLRAEISQADKATWEQGSPRSWAMEAFAVARTVAYKVGSSPGCDADAAPLELPPGYPTIARAVADLQLERAGVRLALVLNRALVSVDIKGA